MATLSMLINKGCGLNSSTSGKTGIYAEEKKREKGKKNKKKEMIVETSRYLLIMGE